MSGYPGTSICLHAWLRCPPGYYQLEWLLHLLWLARCTHIRRALWVGLLSLPGEGREWPWCSMLTWLDAYGSTLYQLSWLMKMFRKHYWEDSEGALVGSWSALILVLHVLPSLCLTGSPLQFWIRLMYVSSRPFLRTFVQLVAVLSFLTPATNAVYPQRIWLFLLGLAPFLLLVLRVSAFGRNANLAGGFAGRRGLVVVFVVWLRFWWITASTRPQCYVPF